MLTLSHIMSISGGRPVAIKTLKFLLENSETDEDLGTLLIFIRDIELWIPGTHLIILSYGKLGAKA